MAYASGCPYGSETEFKGSDVQHYPAVTKMSPDSPLPTEDILQRAQL